MAKPVMETIQEYVRDPEAAERLATADLQLELCDRMVDLRERHRLTQQDLASLVGHSQAYIAKLENGAYERCGIGTLRKFARAMGHEIDIDHLFIPSALASRRLVYTKVSKDATTSLTEFVASIASRGQLLRDENGRIPAPVLIPTSTRLVA